MKKLFMLLIVMSLVISLSVLVLFGFYKIQEWRQAPKIVYEYITIVIETKHTNAAGKRAQISITPCDFEVLHQEGKALYPMAIQVGLMHFPAELLVVQQLSESVCELTLFPDALSSKPELHSEADAVNNKAPESS